MRNCGMSSRLLSPPPSRRRNYSVGFRQLPILIIKEYININHSEIHLRVLSGAFMMKQLRFDANLQSGKTVRVHLLVLVCRLEDKELLLHQQGIKIIAAGQEKESLEGYFRCYHEEGQPFVRTIIMIVAVRNRAWLSATRNPASCVNGSFPYLRLTHNS